MSVLDHVAMALEAIRAHPLRSFLNMLGVIIGVLSVVLLVSVADGLRGHLADTFQILGSNLIEVRPGRSERTNAPPPLNSPRKLTYEDAQALVRRAHQLEALSPIIYGGASIRFRDRRRDVQVTGAGPQHLDLRNIRLGVGRFFSREDMDAAHKVAVIGVRVVQELFGDEDPLGLTLYVADVPFRVVGVIEPKGQTFGFDWDDVVYLPVTAAQELFNLDAITQIICRSRDRTNPQPAIDEIRAILTERHAYQEDFTARSQDDLLATFNGIADTLTLVLLAIASISLVVGGIGIMNIMLVSVKERTREIGIRRAMGARRTDILLQFLVESVVISTLGGALGLGGGAGIIGAVTRWVPDLPLHLSWWVVAVALGFSALVGILSGVVPARSAAAVDVVDALRYE
ncbi:MAG: ABC transporter permease [Deltaproteobacteria bacterium]|nr:ABC transporter permease [Deltaproteobacteria bacterium]